MLPLTRVSDSDLDDVGNACYAPSDDEILAMADGALTGLEGPPVVGPPPSPTRTYPPLPAQTYPPPQGSTCPPPEANPLLALLADVSRRHVDALADQIKLKEAELVRMKAVHEIAAAAVGGDPQAVKPRAYKKRAKPGDETARQEKLDQKRQRALRHLRSVGPTRRKDLIGACGIAPTELKEVFGHEWFEQTEDRKVALTAAGTSAVVVLLP